MTYQQDIMKMYKFTERQFNLYYKLMYTTPISLWPATLRQTMHEWGQKYGTQSHDIRADMVAKWIHDGENERAEQVVE